MNRTESLRMLGKGGAWDVLIIGGGATGLAAAVESSARGYRTALVEQADFAQATSSRSTKLIHGGVRYLQQGKVGLVRDALRERHLLLQNAPELVHPLPLVLPLAGMPARLWYETGLRLYDALAGRHRLGGTRHLSPRALRERVPGLVAEAPGGAMLFHDAQFDDARLAIALARTCASLGGAPANYLRVLSLRKRGARLCGAVVRDEETGETLELEARVVVNATGVFSDAIRRLDEPAAPRSIQPSQGAHLVLPERYLGGTTGVLIPRTQDGRVLFALPWLGRVLLGTTDTPVAEPRLEPRPLAEEVEFLLVHAREALGWEIPAADVRSVFAGLRPLVRQAGASRTAAMSRDHSITISASGLVSIAGGKWTTCRHMGEEVITAAARAAGLPERASRTRTLRLRASASTDVPGAVREEMARTVEDFLARRSRALLLDAGEAASRAPEVAAEMAGLLGRDASWEDGQVRAFRALARGYRL